MQKRENRDMELKKGESITGGGKDKVGVVMVER